MLQSIAEWLIIVIRIRMQHKSTYIQNSLRIMYRQRTVYGFYVIWFCNIYTSIEVHLVEYVLMLVALSF